MVIGRPLDPEQWGLSVSRRLDADHTDAKHRSVQTRANEPHSGSLPDHLLIGHERVDVLRSAYLS